MNLDLSDTQAQGQCQPEGEVPAFPLQQQNQDGVQSCEGEILSGCLMSAIRDDPQAPVKEASCTVIHPEICSLPRSQTHSTSCRFIRPCSGDDSGIARAYCQLVQGGSGRLRAA
jgi:hypothetical protein